MGFMDWILGPAPDSKEFKSMPPEDQRAEKEHREKVTRLAEKSNRRSKGKRPAESPKCGDCGMAMIHSGGTGYKCSCNQTWIPENMINR